MTTEGADDEGTTLLLTIGYALLALALVLVCADATSLHLAHKRADAVAEAAALAGADGFAVTTTSGAPRVVLDPNAVRRQAQSIVDASGSVQLIAADTPDGASVRVTVRVVWRPPVAGIFMPDGVRIDATATSRTALLGG